jgi:hypothetical protein
MSATLSYPTPDASITPRLYFVHIPKTAGVTLKTYLENNYAYGESLVIDEQDARALPPDELRRYRLLSGHYSSEVLHALGERPDVTIMLVREPVARFRSWAAHGRRVSDRRYRDLFEGRSDLDALRGAGAYTCLQAHWVARALREGAGYEGAPTADQLPGLLAEVDLVGVTEHLDRFLQLLAFRMGWTPPQPGWYINRRPDAPAVVRDQASEDEDLEIERRLAVDTALYRLVEARFWEQYAAMLTEIDPVGQVWSAEQGHTVGLDTVQGWLRQHHGTRFVAAPSCGVATADYRSDEPIAGEGWWWRERPKGLAYRWTGPDTRATLVLPPLVPDRSYDLTIDLMGAASWETWDRATLEINGAPVATVRERFGPHARGDVALRMHARLDPGGLGDPATPTELALCVPETLQCLKHVMVLESFDTTNRDLRAVGLAVHRVRVREAMPIGRTRWWPKPTLVPEQHARPAAAPPA